jgi:hypothetical protein
MRQAIPAPPGQGAQLPCLRPAQLPFLRPTGACPPFPSPRRSPTPRTMPAPAEEAPAWAGSSPLPRVPSHQDGHHWCRRALSHRNGCLRYRRPSGHRQSHQLTHPCRRVHHAAFRSHRACRNERNYQREIGPTFASRIARYGYGTYASLRAAAGAAQAPPWLKVLQATRLTSPSRTPLETYPNRSRSLPHWVRPRQ